MTKEYAYLRNEQNNLFLLSPSFQNVNMQNLLLDKTGFYFAEEYKGDLRLSMEGAQLLAREAKDKIKNVVSLNSSELKTYFQGADIDKDLGEEPRFILLKYNQDIFCCAKYKEKKILNFLPKMHRGEVIV